MRKLQTCEVTHDEEVGMGYIYLTDIEAGGVAKTVAVPGEGINLDFDKDGRLVGIEVFNAEEKLPQNLLQ